MKRKKISFALTFALLIYWLFISDDNNNDEDASYHYDGVDV
jgi:hypothetical protein